MPERVLYYASEVNGTVFHHHFLFLIMWEKSDGLMMGSKVFCHSHSILPWEGLQQHHHILIIRTRHQMSNISGILRHVLFWLSCSLIDLTILVEVTCQHGRPWQHCLTWTGSSHLPCFGHFLSHTCGRRRTYLACINCLEEYQNDLGGLEVWLTIPLAVCGNVDTLPTEEENPELHLTPNFANEIANYSYLKGFT